MSTNINIIAENSTHDLEGGDYMDRGTMTVKGMAKYTNIGKNHVYEGDCRFAPIPGHTLRISH